METKTFKIIVIGNGWNIHFNNKLSNFNENFKAWIENICLSIQENTDLYYNLWDKKPALFQFDEDSNKIEQYFTYINEWIQDEWMTHKSITIEEILFKIGEEYNKRAKNNLGFHMFLKKILGYYIDFVCENINLSNRFIYKCQEYKNMEAESIIKDYELKTKFIDFEYDWILTTNYNEYLIGFIKLWQYNSIGTISDYYLTDHNMKDMIANIHGSYLSDSILDLNDRYKNIQINFTNKETKLPDMNQEKLDQYINISSEEYYTFRSLNIEIDFYGISLINDHHIINQLKNVFEKYIYSNTENTYDSIEITKITYYDFENNNQNIAKEKFGLKNDKEFQNTIIERVDVKKHALYKSTEEILNLLK